MHISGIIRNIKLSWNFKLGVFVQCLKYYYNYYNIIIIEIQTFNKQDLTIQFSIQIKLYTVRSKGYYI